MDNSVTEVCVMPCSILFSCASVGALWYIVDIAEEDMLVYIARGVNWSHLLISAN